MNSKLAKAFLATLVLLFSLVPAKAQTEELILGSWGLKKAYIEGMVDSSMQVVLEFRKGGVLYGENSTKKEVIDGTWKQTNFKQLVITNSRVKNEVIHIEKLTKTELVFADDHKAKFYLIRLNNKKLNKARKKLIRKKWEMTKWIKGKDSNAKKKPGSVIFDFNADGVLKVEDKEKGKTKIVRWRLFEHNHKMICTIVDNGEMEVFTVESLKKRGLIMIDSKNDKYYLKAK